MSYRDDLEAAYSQIAALERRIEDRERRIEELEHHVEKLETCFAKAKAAPWVWDESFRGVVNQKGDFMTEKALNLFSRSIT